MNNVNYTLYNEDAIGWLHKQPDHSLPHIITGLPDMEETPYEDVEEYKEFIRRACRFIFQKVGINSYCMFIQTDRKTNKRWLDKSYLIQSVAEQAQIPLRFHKIILLRNPERTHIQRPTYSHYLCFSYGKGCGNATPDVLKCGTKEYKNATCSRAIQHALTFINQYSVIKKIIDPFMGRGSIIKTFYDNGFDVIGIDIDKEQYEATLNKFI